MASEHVGGKAPNVPSARDARVFFFLLADGCGGAGERGTRAGEGCGEVGSAGSRADEGSRGFGIWSNGRLTFRSAGKAGVGIRWGWVFSRTALVACRLADPLFRHTRGHVTRWCNATWHHL